MPEHYHVRLHGVDQSQEQVVHASLEQGEVRDAEPDVEPALRVPRQRPAALVGRDAQPALIGLKGLTSITLVYQCWLCYTMPLHCTGALSR